METLKVQGKQAFFLPTDCVLVLIMLTTRKITSKLSVQSLRVYIRQVITPQAKPFKGYTWKKFKVGRGCWKKRVGSGGGVGKELCQSSKQHDILRQPIDLLFRIHAGRLPVIKHSAAKINKRWGALHLAASKSYLKTTKKISLLLKCHQGTSSVWTQLSNFNDKSFLPAFPSGSPAGRWQKLDSTVWQGIYFLPLSVYKGGSTGKINLDNMKHLLG